MSLWFRYTLNFESPIDEELWESASALLMDEGAEGTFCKALDEQEADGPGTESATADCVEVFFELASADEIEKPKAVIQDTLGIFQSMPAYTITVEPVDEDGWIEMARPHYHATLVSESFIVGPPEEAATFPREEGQHYIAIEFGSAFGTGTHPTTQLCLQFIEELNPMPASVLDVGCGTGVLSVASCFRGAEMAVGMDCFAKAEDQFWRNVNHNRMEDSHDYINGRSPDDARMGCLLAGIPLPELILCNMLSSEFDAFLGPLALWRKPMILSGFLEAELPAVITRLSQTGWKIIEQKVHRDWVGVLCESTVSPSP